MASLKAIIRDQIRENGPLTLDEYMRLALLHPEYGYYQNQQAIGQGGDFITAPEISQMFGELIGLWCVDSWAKMGVPKEFALVEMGPGRGILMDDILRMTSRIPEFMDAAQIHMVEASTKLQKVQQDRLNKYAITWDREFPALPDNLPVIVIGNEFLDALPIKQFKRKEGNWHEAMVELDGDNLTLAYLNMPQPDPLDLPQQAEEDALIECAPDADAFVTALADRMMRSGGAALFMDYGPAEAAFGDSFQAVKDHKFANPFEDPGTADLTAHVQFNRLRELVLKQGCAAPMVEGQGRFLERLGIEARVMQLSRQANEQQQKEIAAAHKRLVSEDGMGTLFKAFAFSSGLNAPLAGFGEIG